MPTQADRMSGVRLRRQYIKDNKRDELSSIGFSSRLLLQALSFAPDCVVVDQN
jgi:hypothetical protein